MIKVQNLSKEYITGSEKVRALDNVSFEIGKGELIALSGASGSGKTTMLNLIGTLDSITAGDIFFEGKSLKNLSEKDKTTFRKLNLGFIFQSYNLIPVLTALENVELAFRPWSRAELEERGFKDTFEASEKALEEVGLSGYEGRRPGELSGGQQQRVAIARAIVRKPSLILADEPTANLDSENSGIVLSIMRDLNEKLGMTVLYSSHDEDVLSSVRRIIVLKDGKIIEDRAC